MRIQRTQFPVRKMSAKVTKKEDRNDGEEKKKLQRDVKLGAFWNELIDQTEIFLTLTYNFHGFEHVVMTGYSTEL